MKGLWGREVWPHGDLVLWPGSFAAPAAAAWPAPHPPPPRACWRRCWPSAAPRQRPGGSRQLPLRACGPCWKRKEPRQVPIEGSPWSPAGTVCPPGGPSPMAKPAGQKRWTAPGALQGPGWASRVRCTPLGDPPKALPPALPVRTSPSSRSVEGEPGDVDGLLGRVGGGGARAWFLGLLQRLRALSRLNPGGRVGGG